MIARDSPDHPIGMTVSSFASVSLNPPLVLVCVNKRSSFLSTLSVGNLYSINFLNGEQDSISDLFARDFKAFERVAWKYGGNGAPCLADCVATLECALQSICPVGDHCLLVGLVIGKLIGGGVPLIRWKREYRSLARHCDSMPQGLAKN